MSLIRSVIHMLWMLVTVVPYAIAILLGALFGVRGEPLYRIAAAWLGLCISGARVLLGIRTHVMGMENLPLGKRSPAILLVKHQSTFETFLMPVIMPPTSDSVVPSHSRRKAGDSVTAQRYAPRATGCSPPWQR